MKRHTHVLVETWAASAASGGRASLNGSLRTVDVARRLGCSGQHVRDLERDGVIPPAARTPSGYRLFGERHVAAATAYRSLSAAVGPVKGKHVLRAAHEQPGHAALEMLDELHAGLAAERRDVRLAREAVASITAEPLDAPRLSDAMTISELAAALGVTLATLRHWEAEGLVRPDRTGTTARRVYTPAQVRDVRVVHQLRLAGYRIPQLRSLLHDLLAPAAPHADLHAALDAREHDLAVRSRALLRAAASLDGLVGETVQRRTAKS